MNLSTSAWLKHIEVTSVVSLTKRLIRIPSVTGQEEEIAEFVANELERLGLEVQLMGEEAERPNVVGRLLGSVGKPALVLNAHIDTVPPGDVSSWSVDPYSAEEKDGRIYGRGSCDNKSAVAAMIEAVKAIKKSKIKLKGDLLLEFVVDEERGGYEGTKWLLDRGVKGDYAVVCDGELEVATCHKGDYSVELTSLGRLAHAARPYEGINAVHQMINVANALLSIPHRYGWQNRKHTLCGIPYINVSVIDGGIQRNMVPDKCRMVIDRRVVPGLETLEDAKNEIETVLSELQRKDSDLTLKKKEIIAIEPQEISKGESVVEALIAAYERVVGTEPKIAGCMVFTDAHWFTNNYNIPAVCMGVSGGNEHGTDEYVEVDSLLTAAKIYSCVSVDLLL